MDIDQLRKVLKGRRIAAGDTPLVVPIPKDKLFSLVNLSATRMVDPPSPLRSGWPFVVEFLKLDTLEAREFVEQLPTKCWRLHQPRWARRLRPRKLGISVLVDAYLKG